MFAELVELSNRKLQFIIETHSEYMIRRSQVLVLEVKNRKIEDLDMFKTFYFPIEGEPYDMCYKENGRFERKFQTGFFDEADILALKLL